MENLLLFEETDSTYLSLVPRERVHLRDDTFGFCISDSGGFTGIIITIKQWEEMKQKVDDYVNSIKGGIGT